MPGQCLCQPNGSWMPERCRVSVWATLSERSVCGDASWVLSIGCRMPTWTNLPKQPMCGFTGLLWLPKRCRVPIWPTLPKWSMCGCPSQHKRRGHPGWSLLCERSLQRRPTLLCLIDQSASLSTTKYPSQCIDVSAQPTSNKLRSHRTKLFLCVSLCEWRRLSEPVQQQIPCPLVVFVAIVTYLFASSIILFFSIFLLSFNFHPFYRLSFAFFYDIALAILIHG